MPHRVYKRFWHRLLHDSTADEMARSISQLAHANVTQVPYHLGRRDVGLATGVPVLAAALADELGAATIEIDVPGESWNEIGASMDVVRAVARSVRQYPAGAQPARGSSTTVVPETRCRDFSNHSSRERPRVCASSRRSTSQRPLANRQSRQVPLIDSRVGFRARSRGALTSREVATK